MSVWGVPRHFAEPLYIWFVNLDDCKSEGCTIVNLLWCGKSTGYWSIWKAVLQHYISLILYICISYLLIDFCVTGCLPLLRQWILEFKVLMNLVIILTRSECWIISYVICFRLLAADGTQTDEIVKEEGECQVVEQAEVCWLSVISLGSLYTLLILAEICSSY